MKEIKGTGELIAVATRQGVKLTGVEADIALDYLEGHNYCLMLEGGFRMKLHDLQDGESHENDMDYTIRDVVEFCQEMNSELLLENTTADEPDQNYVMELRKDELILDGMMKKADTVIPPVIRIYNVAIIEHLEKVVPVEAASWAEAEMKVRDAWKNGEYILSADDFAGVMFSLAN